MVTKNHIRSVGELLIADSVILNKIKSRNRIYVKNPFKNNPKTIAITLWLDTESVVGVNLPANNYNFEIGIWNIIGNNNSLEDMMDVKDKVIDLVNKKPDTLNAQGYGTKFRTFDLVSAVLSDEYVGSMKLWFLPCIFNCIIGD